MCELLQWVPMGKVEIGFLSTIRSADAAAVFDSGSCARLQLPAAFRGVSRVTSWTRRVTCLPIFYVSLCVFNTDPGYEDVAHYKYKWV